MYVLGPTTLLVLICFSLEYRPNPLAGFGSYYRAWLAAIFLRGKVFSALHFMKTFKAIHFLQILVQYYRYGDAVNLLQPLYMAALNVGENSGQHILLGT
jgi:hypothetical protein